MMICIQAIFTMLIQAVIVNSQTVLPWYRATNVIHQSDSDCNATPSRNTRR